MGNDNGRFAWPQAVPESQGNSGKRFAYREHLEPALREEDEKIHAMFEACEEEGRQQRRECPECKRLHHLVQEREDSYHQQGRMLRQMWAENRQLRQQLDALRAKLGKG